MSNSSNCFAPQASIGRKETFLTKKRLQEPFSSPDVEDTASKKKEKAITPGQLQPEGIRQHLF